MKSAGAHFHVIGLQNDATQVGPITLQGENEPLKRSFGPHMERQVFKQRVFVRHLRPLLVERRDKVKPWKAIGVKIKT
jgi:hypothetical protein